VLPSVIGSPGGFRSRAIASFVGLAELADADPVLALGRDVKFLCGFLNRAALMGRFNFAQVLGAVADDVYGPAGH
jgi:hypothetical protein